MTDPPLASGIVLAGGRSTRFGTNKLAATVHGRPLLHLAIEALARCCTEVIVVAPSTGLDLAVPDEAAVPLRVVADNEPYPGPLAALLTGARHASQPLLLCAGGDMPDLAPRILRLLLDAATPPAEGAVLGLGRDDAPQLLPIALARSATVAHAPFLLEAGRRSLHALVDRLGPRVIPEHHWRPLDPEARTLRDIDRASDLDTFQP